MLILKEHDLLDIEVEKDIRLIFKVGTQEFLNMLIDVIEHYPTIELLANQTINIFIDEGFHLKVDKSRINDYLSRFKTYQSDKDKRQVNAYLTLKINQIYTACLTESERYIYVEKVDNQETTKDNNEQLTLDDLKNMKVIELRFLARDLGVDNYARKNRMLLIEELEAIKNQEHKIVWNN